MIVDTSAIVAILRNEADAPALVEALGGADRAAISAGTYLEAAIVVDSNRDPVLSRRLDELLDVARVEIEPVTARQAELARRAYQDFGKGSGHRAGLNFGDCFAYALCRDRGEPLLFKGGDFTHTDVVSVLSAPALGG